MVNINDLSKIGIGTWGIGGFAERNPQNDDKKQVEAIKYAFDKGINIIESTYWYSEGKAVELICKAIYESLKKRQDIFLSSTIYPYRNPKLIDAEKEMDVLLKTLHTDYIDNVQFSLSSLPQWGRKDSIKLLKKWLDQKVVRFVGITNFDLENLKDFKSEFGDKLFSHELNLNFEIRENQDLGIVDFALNNHIRNIIFQPLRRNRSTLRRWPLLLELSEKYSKTQNQIIISWLLWKKCLPFIKSETIAHIDEYLEIQNYKMEESDYLQIDAFRPPNWISPKIDWYKTGEGQPIFNFSNIFDEEYDKQNSIV